MFLRVSWLVGQSGILLALLTVVLGNIVTTITSLSMSAVATNGRIQAGGVYYMISRSLGPEFGGSIGLMFTLANSIASATYIIGFTDSLKDLMYYYFDGAKIIDGAVNDTRIVGTVTLIGVLGLAIVGMDWVTRVQMGLLLLLIGSQVDFVVGAIMGPQGDEQEAQGFIGINSELFSRNMGPDYRKFEGNTQGFFSVFGVFFTAVTGIVAGANLSGDLKDPAVAIPKGTLAAIATTFVSYIIFPVLIGAAAMRDASGNTTLYQLYRNQTMEDPDTPYNFWENPVFTSESCSKTGGTDENMKEPCEFGMQNSFQVMELMAAWGPLIYAGCFAATLSSAIGSLVGAPRVLQALAKDKLYPGIYLFSKGSGANNDPVRGYVLVFIISFVCIMLGDLNLVSTLLSNFFLASYSLINFSCFHASLIKSPGWRPGFKYYNLWISLVGGILCLIVMFLIDWVTALVTFIITIALYLYVSYRNPDVNWGSSTQAQTYVSALNSTLDLNMVEEHVKNYRPQLLVLSGEVRSRPPLLHLAHLLTKNISLLICGHVIQTEPSQRVRNSLSKQSYTWFTKHKIRAFYSVVEGMTLEHGAKSLCKLVGLGKLKPNTVLLGFKSNWRKCDKNELRAYFNTLHEALDMHMALMILRVPQGLDYSQITEDEELLGNTEHYGTTLDNTKNMTVKDGTDSESSTPPSSPKLDCGGVVGAGRGTEDTAAPGGAEEDGGGPQET
ncbi:hypothetical protein Pcinc_007192 [Petrolisthes cinctipes]|uniref:Uncharacterized protein n=1 Tax=Petrolisthes cinctipes TaxID=88211 RepID=A0AAE1L0S8_PETCI|nr:hypothetical protein Pcinc_007192 [Petrolisthes cinctipes]